MFADIWCPFTHVGLRLVDEQLRQRGREDVIIRVRAWPLEWVNGRRMNPHKALEHVNELRLQVADDLFTGFDVSAFPTSTVPVLALVARAYGRDPGLGRALSFGARDWLFERGLDVSEPGVLADLADSFGVDLPEPDDYATVVSDWKEGRSRGVVGSPHFFCGKLDVFCPSLNIAKDPDTQSPTIRTNLNRLEEFLDGCL